MQARLTEAAFTRQVAALARLHGWLIAHFRPARTAKGWRTACEFDAAGFPDLFLVRPRDGRLLAAELKVGQRKPTEEQLRWLSALEDAGVPTYFWRPDDWNAIEDILA